MPSEAEILSKHIQCLHEGRDACLELAKNADPEKAAPRGRPYGNLKRALKALEGTCRQMAFHRADARWTKLGFVYARAMRIVYAKFMDNNWAAFKEISQLFEIGLKRMEALATAKTGRTGAILPKRTDFLILPDVKTPGSFRGTTH